jgi:hypothetical protein
VIAPAHKDVGDGFADSFARRDGQQVRLRFLAGDIREISRLEGSGLLEHRPRHGDVVVHGKPHENRGRRFAHGSERSCKLYQRRLIHAVEQPVKDLREQIDLLAVEPGCVFAKKRRDTKKRFGSARSRAMIEDLIQLRQEQD